MVGVPREPGDRRSRPGRWALPQDLAVQVQGGDHRLVVDVAGGVDQAAGQRDAGKPFADALGRPEQLGPAVGPFFSSPVSVEMLSPLGPWKRGQDGETSEAFRLRKSSRLRTPP